MCFPYVEVTAPSRLHITLIDMHGSFSGRVDGGVGVALESPATKVRAEHVVGDFEVFCSHNGSDESREAVLGVLRSLQQWYGLPPAKLTVTTPLMAHAGLGSKTALLLSAGRAYTALNGLDLNHRDMSRAVGRGGTSGVGTEAFNQGGLIVDCGHSFAEKGLSFRASSRSKDMPPLPLSAATKCHHGRFSSLLQMHDKSMGILSNLSSMKSALFRWKMSAR